MAKMTRTTTGKAKKGMREETKDAYPSPWEGFTDLHHDEWSITYDTKADRGFLKNGDRIKVMDISLSAIKRFAELHYNIAESDWKHQKAEPAPVPVPAPA